MVGTDGSEERAFPVSCFRVLRERKWETVRCEERAASRGVCGRADRRLRDELEQVTGAGAEVVFLDAPPRAGADVAAREAARVADLVVVPVRPTVVDLEAAAETLARIQNVTARVVRIGNRIAYSRSLIDGRVAQELEPGGKAADEIASVCDVLIAHIRGKR